jgi:hypothetical protein
VVRHPPAARPLWSRPPATGFTSWNAARQIATTPSAAIPRKKPPASGTFLIPTGAATCRPANDGRKAPGSSTDASPLVYPGRLNGGPRLVFRFYSVLSVAIRAETRATAWAFRRSVLRPLFQRADRSKGQTISSIPVASGTRLEARPGSPHRPGTSSPLPSASPWCSWKTP